MNVAYLFCFDIDGTLRDNKYHEVSDSTLKALHLLKEKGYNIARRTIAKYREQLDIPVARLRKEL